ncbi:MAG: hypothetical protein A2W26_11315 [Acidobacteria bacterium RBG_16_64_8]|nr:MAG: hypothetical protein A2W26_11315 [Acidobacteria bacterium RBG_16_64_8]
MSLVSESATATLSKRVAQLKHQGREVIDLGQGEAEDLFAPPHVQEAAWRAIRDNQTKYTPTAGTLELREAIAYRFAQDNGLRVQPSQVMASTGAKQGVFNFMMAVLDPGDEVLVPAPYWVSYIHQVKLAGGQPVVVPTSPQRGFKVMGDTLRQYLTSRTRALVLNNPNNPSGAVYTREELLDILDVVLSAGVLVLADEVYDRLTFDGAAHVSMAALTSEAAAVTVTVNAVSKRYCMTGWRLGFAAGPQELIAAMERVQSHTTSCPNGVAQRAATAALTGDQQAVVALRHELDARRRAMVGGLRGLPGLQCWPIQGSFYAFPSVPGFESGAHFAEALLEATGVIVVPGDAFGMPEHVRLCFAASRTSLDRALERMSVWLRPGAATEGQRR